MQRLGEWGDGVDRVGGWMALTEWGDGVDRGRFDVDRGGWRWPGGMTRWPAVGMTLTGEGIVDHICENTSNAIYCYTTSIVQGYQKKVSLQRQLCKMSVLLYLWFPATIELFLFVWSLNKPWKYYIQGRRLNLTWKSSNFMSFKSSLQSHPLWVTLYMRCKLLNYKFF